MSTYWGYYCRDCKVASDYWHNHGADMLAEFHSAWHAIRESKTEWIRVGTDSQWADLDMSIFLEEHEGHKIALQNEYGDIEDMSGRGRGCWRIVKFPTNSS